MPFLIQIVLLFSSFFFSLLFIRCILYYPISYWSLSNILFLFSYLFVSSTIDRCTLYYCYSIAYCIYKEGDHLFPGVQEIPAPRATAGWNWNHF